MLMTLLDHPGSMRRRSALVKITVTLSSIVLAFVACEIFVREFALLAGRPRLIIYDEVLGWRLLPGVAKRHEDERSYTVETNSRGLRDKEYPHQRPEGSFRVLVLGDSFVFGSGGVESQERFTEIIERKAATSR